MSLSGILIAAGTATTNPDPNGLSPESPYPSTYVDWRTVSDDWETQAATKCKALFHRGGIDKDKEFVSIPVEFVPSDGAAVTYTVTLWYYNHLAASWAKVKDNNPVSYTGHQSDYIDLPFLAPIFIQLSSISAGEVAIYYDNGIAEAH
jgi:hypothetical protein